VDRRTGNLGRYRRRRGGGCLAGQKRRGLAVAPFADAIAPALLVAQAVGRIGNYFNQELFGGPTTLPWALFIDPRYRPAGYRGFHTFQPTFLYELIFDLALAALLVWLGHHTKVRPPGLFALYVTGYSAFRIFEESLRIDSSEHFLGLRLNFYVASALTLAGIAWFIIIQRRKPAATSADSDGAPGEVGESDSGAVSETSIDAKSSADGEQQESVPDKTGRRT